MQSKQKTNLPQKFIQFINTIIEVQTQTDTWKSKLFYVPVDDVCRILMEQGGDGGDNQLQQQQIQTTNEGQQQQQHTNNNNNKQHHHITLSSILTFIQTTSQCDLTQQQQKVIQKYFNFSQKLSCTKQQFIKRLKPINNKLILSIEKQQIETKEMLNKLFKSILQGYERIHPLRNSCAQLFLQIKKYFHTQQLHKSSCNTTLSKQALKQFMFEADIYGRVNFAYVKDYVFGDKEEIQWSVLLGMKDNGELEKLYQNQQQQQQQNKKGQLLLSQQQQVRINYNIKNKQRQLQELLNKGKFEEIVQLQEENIVTEKVILGNGGHYQQRQQQQQQQQQQEQDGQQQQKQRQQKNQLQQPQQLQKQSQQQVQPSTITTTQTQLITTKPTTTTKQQHKQITEIEQLLNRTKQRYQKNKEKLQSQAINIKNQQQQQQQSSILLNRKQSGRFAYTSRVNQIYQQIKYDKMRMESNNNNNRQQQQQQHHVQKESINKLQLQSQQPKDQKYHHQSLTTTPIKQQQLKNNVFSHKISQQLQQQLVQHKNKYDNNKQQYYKLSQQQLQQQQQQQHQQIKLHTPSPLNSNAQQSISISNNKNNNMQQSLVKPLFTRQAMRKEIYDTLGNSNEINDYFNVNNSEKIGASEEIRFDQTHGAIITPSYQSTQRREVGKIKRRSMSKDIGVGNNNNNNTYTPSAIITPATTTNYNQSTTTTPINSLAKTFTFPQQEKQPRNNNYYSSINSINNNKNTNITNYHQYEAVLKEIKKQQTQYKNILDAREKIIGDKQKQTRKKRLTLDNVGVGSKINTSPQSSGIYKRYTPINSLLQVQKSQKPHKQSSMLSQYTQQQRFSASMQKPTISHSRYEEIMKEIQTNSLARSRVSSKKRQEIVQKATSQARLRIQQIENRALKRLAKVDSTERYSVSKKTINSYLNLDSTVEVDKQYQMPKYKKTKQNPTNIVSAVAKSQKSSSPKNYFMNDMLNERPTGLKLTSNYRQKY